MKATETATPKTMAPRGKRRKRADSESEGETHDDDDTLSIEVDGNLMKELDADLEDSDDTKTLVASLLTQLVSKRFKNRLSDEKLKGKLDEYARPSNCEDLWTPTVNPKIWKVLPAWATGEKGLFEDGTILQQMIGKAATAINESMQHCSASNVRVTPH